jgi:hypothetical protein
MLGPKDEGELPRAFFAYGTLRSDDRSGASWTASFNKGMASVPAVLPAATLWLFGAYAAVGFAPAVPAELAAALAITPAAAGVAGRLIFPLETRPDGSYRDDAELAAHFADKLATADAIECYPAMYERCVAGVRRLDTGALVDAVVYHRTFGLRQLLRELVLRTDDAAWLRLSSASRRRHLAGDATRCAPNDALAALVLRSNAEEAAPVGSGSEAHGSGGFDPEDVKTPGSDTRPPQVCSPDHSPDHYACDVTPLHMSSDDDVASDDGCASDGADAGAAGLSFDPLSNQPQLADLTLADLSGSQAGSLPASAALAVVGGHAVDQVPLAGSGRMAQSVSQHSDDNWQPPQPLRFIASGDWVQWTTA